jgi:hypothetical protein
MMLIKTCDCIFLARGIAGEPSLMPLDAEAIQTVVMAEG